MMSKGKDRLAAPGFYVTYYGTESDNLDKPEAFGVVFIPESGTVIYIYIYIYIYFMGDSWSTLLWTCAPTKKQINKALKAKPDKIMDRFIYFKTHTDLCIFKFINNKIAALLTPQ